jgi:exosome complex exonuclease DIS3/RRP44
MPAHKNANRFKYGQENEPVDGASDSQGDLNVNNPNKRVRPNSSSTSSTRSSVMEADPSILDLSAILDRASANPETLSKVTSMILSNPAVKNSIAKLLIPEVDQMKIEISDLRQRVDDLEQYSRKNCLKISGIPESRNGKVNIEDTDQIALNVINKYVLAGTGIKPMQEIAICNSHRLGRRPRPGTQDPPRDIIIKFARYRDRATVYNNKKHLKSFNRNPSNNYKIYINEALTSTRAKIYSELRKLRREQVIHSCWTFDGNIFLKRSETDRKIRVRSENDLSDLVHKTPDRTSTPVTQV